MKRKNTAVKGGPSMKKQKGLGPAIIISKTKVTFSPLTLHRAAVLKLSEDMLTVTGEKGYCMTRTSHGIREGKFYFEMTVEPSDNEESHCRLGWSTSRGDLQGPTGYDEHSYGYRDIDGSKVHKSIRTPYGEPYGVGDVMGFSIDLPSLALREASAEHQAEENNHNHHNNNHGPTPSEPVAGARGAGALSRNIQTYNLKALPDTEIRFYKNGVDQGVAFTNIFDGTYFPAASLYMGAVVRFNPGPHFKFPPIDTSFKPFSSMLGVHVEETEKKNNENKKEDEGIKNIENNDVAMIIKQEKKEQIVEEETEKPVI